MEAQVRRSRLRIAPERHRLNSKESADRTSYRPKGNAGVRSSVALLCQPPKTAVTVRAMAGETEL